MEHQATLEYKARDQFQGLPLTRGRQADEGLLVPNPDGAGEKGEGMHQTTERGVSAAQGLFSPG